MLSYTSSPEVVVTTRTDPTTGRVCVSVSDNGRGIPHESRRKVFRRFVRLGTELEREKPGLGLGLYIVRTLVARLRGRVRVRGRDNVNGTTFEVLLPGAQSRLDFDADDHDEAIDDVAKMRENFRVLQEFE